MSWLHALLDRWWSMGIATRRVVDHRSMEMRLPHTVKNWMPRLPEARGPCELVIVDSEGRQFLFRLTKAQVRLGAIILHEIRERME